MNLNGCEMDNHTMYHTDKKSPMIYVLSVDEFTLKS